MNPSLFELVTLRDGIKSLRLIENQEIFHPGIGPVAEANQLHVEQNQLLERANRLGRFTLWDVGLGAMANAIAAIQALAPSNAQIEIHSFDQTDAPARFALENAHELHYPAPYRALIQKLLDHHSVQITPKLTWKFHLGDFRATLAQGEIPAPDSIFYDPYSPSSNVEMWRLEHFQNLRARLDDTKECLLTNYTRSTAVRVTWLLAGFYVGVGKVIGQKAETTIASNHLKSLAAPLGLDWIKRVKASRNSAPMRENQYNLAPISEKDLATLLNHPQFRS